MSYFRQTPTSFELNETFVIVFFKDYILGSNLQNTTMRVKSTKAVCGEICHVTTQRPSSRGEDFHVLIR